MSRVPVKGLTPGDDVAIQVRAKKGEEVSEWSPIFKFHVSKDLKNPKIPQNITWQAEDDSFHAEWDHVTQNVDNSDTTIVRYDLQFRKTGTGAANIKGFGIVPIPGDKMTYDLTYEKATAMFGRNIQSLDFRVQAVNVAKNESDWSAWFTASIEAPDPVTNLVATPMNFAIKLTWDAPANMQGVYGYLVRVGPDADHISVTPSYAGTATTYTYYTLGVQTAFFKVTTYSKSGLESTPAYANATSLPNGDDIPPGVPESVNGTIVNNPDGTTATGTVNWTMTSPAADLNGFDVQYKPHDDTVWQMNRTDKDARTTTFQGIAYTNYDVRVRSFDTMGNSSAWTAVVLLEAEENEPPAAITGLTATPSVTSVHLEWNPSEEDDVKGNNGYYEFQISSDPSFPATTATASYTSGDPQYDAVGLSENTEYYARVRAVDSGDAEGPWSDVVTFTTGQYPALPNTDGLPPTTSPTPIVTGGIGYIHVGWSPISNPDPVTYEVHMSTISGFTPSPTTLAAEVSGTMVVLKTDPADDPLEYGETYYIRIVATDQDPGSAPPGTEVSGTLKKAVDDDIEGVSFAKVTTGVLETDSLTIGAGGSIATANGEVFINEFGIIVTGTSSQIVANAISTGTLVASTSITVQGTLTVSSSGWIQSSDFPGGTSGYRLTNSMLIVRNGQISASTFVAGTIGNQGRAAITVAAGSYIDVQSGYIMGGGYNGALLAGSNERALTGATGWYIGSNGIAINNGAISASAFKGGTFNAGTIIIASGGTIRSQDTISGTPDGTQPKFSLSSAGINAYSGVIGGIEITNNSIKSEGYSSGASTGFLINAAGDAFFNNLNVEDGVISGASIVGTVQIASGRVVVYNPSFGSTYLRSVVLEDDSLKSYNASGFTSVHINGTPTGSEPVLRTRGPVKIDPSPSGTPASGRATFDCNVNARFNRIDIGAGSSYFTIAPSTPDLWVSGHIEGASNFYLQSQTGGSTVAAEFTSGGRLQRNTSSRKTKKDITPLVIDVEKVLALEPKRYKRIDTKSHGDRYYAGFIAEDAHELGLTDWVAYDKNESPDGFHYPEFSAAHHAVLRHEHQRINELETENAALRSDVEELKVAVAELKKNKK
jgi:hypothetical protein